ncbi:MAG: discoidin domain-containing protein [Ruminococcus sp.]|nr:discoidin domain-containing protein [Ruminococcus sp.]
MDFPAEIPAAKAASVVTVSPMDTYAINNGVFEGWGTSLCWWANRIGYSDSLAQQAADAFYGEDGLRLNIARFNIGGGDDPSHTHITRTDSDMPGYTVYQNGTVTYDWSADAAQRNVLLRCVEAAGDDAIVEMFSNSPPYYMCQSGCSSGNTDAGKNNLKDGCYDDFAEYLAEVCKHYQDEWGIRIQSVEPLNEPATNFWYAGSPKQEGCHFDTGASESLILTELKKSMDKRGMGDVIICGTDETSIDLQITAFNALSDEAKNTISRIDTHTYSGSRRGELRDTALSAGKNLWMSEVDGNGTAGTNAGEMAAGLWLAGRITDDCNGLNASAWILWQVIDKHICAAGYKGRQDSGMPDISAGFWGTAVADHDNDTIILTKKYYCFGQYSRYIRPGMTMLNSASNTMAAFDKENGQLVLVAYNTSGSASDMTFDLTQFDSVGASAQAIRTSSTENWANAGTTAINGKMLNVSLAPNSVTTFIIDGVKGSTDLGRKLEPAEVSGTDSWKSDSKNGFANAFDGDMSTYFDGVTSGWVQADLGESYEITALGYCPRSGYEYRAADSMFIVSDDAVNWTKIYTINGKPSYGMHYFKPEGGAVSARYVRYCVPEGAPNNGVNRDSTYCCNVAEIEIYGDAGGSTELNEITIPASNVTGSDPWKNSVNDCRKAFDGNNSTYFDGVGAGWVQADLGGEYSLTRITYCPRKGYEYRAVDSFFEVSSDGESWTVVHTFVSQPSGVRYIDLGGVTARYVRYRVPEGTPDNGVNHESVYCCNVAEIHVFGDPVTEVAGDVNADGEFNVADAVLLQKWLLGVPDTVLVNWQAADICGDGILDIFDLCAMRQLLAAA